MFALEADVPMPAARGNVINKDNAGSVLAKSIAEAANVPITHDAMDILESKGIRVVPDIVANSGDVVASMEEYSRSLAR